MSEINRRQLLKQSLTVPLSLGAAGLSSPLLAAKTGALSFEEYRRYDALGLAELVRQREVSSGELLRTATQLAAALNPTLNCVVERFDDRAETAIESGLNDGLFTGVPFLLKDLGMALKGTVTTNGSRFFETARPDYTSTIVQRYQQAGLVIFGKTASPEFGGTATTESILFGDTHNPWDLSRTSGGSSGGAAVAVAAGILPMANATDGGGSIRIPASCCGLFGLKPSRGRTPHGPVQLSSTLSVIHGLSRSVRDSAALLDVTWGAEPGQTLIAPRPKNHFYQATQTEPGALRIGLIRTPLTHSPVDPECHKAAHQAAKLCESLGHNVDEVDLPVDPRKFFGAFGIVMAAGLVDRIQQRELQLGREVTEQDLEPITWLHYQGAKQKTAEQLFHAQQALEQISRDVAQLQRDYDVLLSPTLATPPVKLGKLSLNQDNASYEREAINASAFTMLYNATGQPAMSVPLHWTESGLPVGVMFAGRYGEEYTLLQLAARLEKAQPWFDRVPDVSGFFS
ncbi:amidase [Aestuariicella hydrocarbonica]|uniref:Amidase n=1 Tax=Pseudomaricurvus hydrocarbonicus TaxID=1470433 RepID=A0A9E5MK57_9GAMM|nr:amidase [Aestuariicella hydrocarbonica]NHO66054.1 amidase [Aestuariicella hydrocarbonica]